VEAKLAVIGIEELLHLLQSARGVWRQRA